MPCFVESPSCPEQEWIEYMLCQACRYLTIEQLIEIQGLDCYQGLYDWYKHHITMDFMRNHAENNEEEKNRCIDEAKRIGCKLYIDECGLVCMGGTTYA